MTIYSTERYLSKEICLIIRFKQVQRLQIEIDDEEQKRVQLSGALKQTIDSDRKAKLQLAKVSFVFT